jgi:DNA ligase-associated metallophosphoesterase
MTQTIQIRNNKFKLHPTGAIFWHEQKMLLISDLHLGKISHFRKHGAAVPREAIGHNYKLMDQVLGEFDPETVCFLGDLFHSYINNEWQLFESWAIKTQPKMILVAGNHDIISPLRYAQIGVEVVDELEISPFLLTHFPIDRPNYFNFSGHIHPAIRLRGPAKQSLRLPCFFKSPDQLILPAFGKFTGTHTLKPKKNDLVYAITKNEVIQVTH